MARVTIEDCKKKEGINDHFELVAVATERTRQIISGAPITVARNNDKYPVIALREIAGDKLQIEAIKDLIINRQCKRFVQDNLEDGHDSGVRDDSLMDDADYVASELDFEEEGIDIDYDPSMFSDEVSIDDDEKII